MVDLAIGISKVAVQILADRVKNAIKQEEAEKWQIVQRDLVFVTGEVEMMQSFLDTADGGERMKNNVVMRTWVRQVSDLSCDVEDFTEFVLRLLALPLESGEALPLDEAVAEVEQLKARAVDVSQRSIRYCLIGHPLAQVKETASAGASTKPSDIVTTATKQKSCLLDVAGLITRNDPELQVISVCGPDGDNGKIAIARRACSDLRIYKRFKCRAWVKVTDPFDREEFLWSLMSQFYTHSSQEEQEASVGQDVTTRMMQASPLGDLIMEFIQKVNTQRYLIVLEDISTVAQWVAIRSCLPDQNRGSRIVVLTDQLMIARLCTEEPCRVSEIRQFSPDRSVFVVFKEGFQRDEVASFITEQHYHSVCDYSLIGRDIEVDKLFQQTWEHHLISVWGMPGVGKSVLVRAVHDKHRSSDNFQKLSWVNVSHLFNPMDFSRDLLLDLQSDEIHAEALQTEDPIKECRDLLHQYKCLVVIDSMQSKENWDWIKENLIQFGNSESCIIIITPEESVAKHCSVSSNHAVYNVKGLEAPEAFQLFKKVIEENGSSLEQEMMTAQAEIILSKCGGFPSVIVAVAEYLATRARDTLNQEMKHLSANFMHELETKPVFGSLEGLLSWMPSYLHACPRYLKACMLYVSIFPPDKIIRRRRLVRRWIAEGYSKGTNSISMEKYAEKVLDELVTLSILQPALKASKVTGCYRVNGFFREYIISRPKEERIMFPVEVSALENGHEMMYRLTTEGIGQHLAVGSTWEKDQSVFESFDFSRLRSLTMFRRLQPFYVDYDTMRVLRVLDLENATADLSDTNLELMGKLPPRLKFLSLRGHQGISRLPDSFGDLLLLETLDIRDTEIATLPPCITNLRKLQYIRAGASVQWSQDDGWAGDEEQSTPSSSRLHTMIPLLHKFRRGRRRPVGSLRRDPEMPRGTKHLTALQTLGAVSISSVPIKDIVDAFFYLKQLKKLDVSGINQENKGWLFPALLNNNHLESLSLHLETRHDVLCWSNIPSRHCLQSLNLYGRVEEPPSDDIMGLCNLKKLTLDMTILFTREVLQSIGGLPSLQILRLTVKKGRDQDGELRFSAGLFSKLQVLQITCHSRLHVIFDGEAMEKLKLLKIHYSFYQPSLNFYGLERLVCLQQVVLIHYMREFHDDALMEALQQQLDRHHKKPALKLEWVQHEEDERRKLARWGSLHHERHWMIV